VNEAIHHLIGRHGEQEFSAAFTIENITSQTPSARSAEQCQRGAMLDHMISAETVVAPPADRRTDQPVFTEPLRLD
jgi:hypothetical protein